MLAEMANVHLKGGSIAQSSERKALRATIAECCCGRQVLVMVSVGRTATLRNEARAFASGPMQGRCITANADPARAW
jgi:hypothetical protein